MSSNNRMKSIKKYCYTLIFIANLLVVLGFWWMSSGDLFRSTSADVILALGRLAGLLAVNFILLQFILMGRAIWLEKSFGLDKLANIHRLNGYCSITFILIHPTLLIISYAMSGKVGLIAQFVDFFINYQYVYQAVFAVVLFITIVFLSIYIVRKRLRYEIWYFIHLLTYVAVALVFGHQLVQGGDFVLNPLFVFYWYFLYAFVFGNVLIFRFLRPLYNFYRYRFSVANLAQETEDTTSVYVQGKNLQQFKIDAGQFLIFRFLSKNFWWQAHPFSLSFVPKNDQLRVTIKNCGDFTAKIPTLKQGTKVWIEGPFGIFTAPSSPTKKFLFLAGGVGITPIRSLIEKVAPDHDLIVLYSNKNSQNIIFKNELDELSKKYHFPLHYIMSAEETSKNEKGRIDKEKLDRLVKDINEREIYICGPISMIESIREILKNLNVKAEQIHFEEFKF